MTNQPRPAGLHPDTFKRFERAANCVGYPPPPIVETLSTRFSDNYENQSDGNFLNEQGHSEAYSSTFCCSLQLPSPFNGETLHKLGTCLIHHGIVMFAPLLHKSKPYTYLLAFDTRLPLRSNAAYVVARFLEHEGEGYALPYSQSWARDIPRNAWPGIEQRIRDNLKEFSNFSF